MHAKVVSIDIGGDGHGFEAADESLVDVLIVEFLKDLRSEREVLCHSSGLVVTSEHNDVLGVVQFEAEKENAHFKREDATIDVISQEQKIGSRDALWIDNLFEHVNHVKELTMDVTDDDDRLLDAKHVCLLAVDSGDFL